MPSVAVSEPVILSLHEFVKNRVQNTNSLRSDRCILNSNTNSCEPRITKTPANATEGIWLLALCVVGFSRCRAYAFGGAGDKLLALLYTFGTVRDRLPWAGDIIS